MQIVGLQGHSQVGPGLPCVPKSKNQYRNEIEFIKKILEKIILLFG
jgi:hypothetical protein